MRALQIFTVACFAVVIVMFFSKCKPSSTSTVPSGLVYNKDSAKVHFISVDTAMKLTSTFRLLQRANATRLKDSSYIVNFPLAERFNRDAILALLDQNGAKGVRIYLGEDRKGPVKMVIVAVDSLGNDITGRKSNIVKPASNGSSGDGVVLEAGQRCPTLCNTNSVLNN